MSGYAMAGWADLTAAAPDFLERPIDPALCDGWGFAKPTIASLLKMFAHLGARKHEGFITATIEPDAVRLRAYAATEADFWGEVMIAFVTGAAAAGARGEALFAGVVDHHEVVEARRLTIDARGKVKLRRLPKKALDADAGVIRLLDEVISTALG